MKPTFEVHKTRKGFHFNLKAPNGEIILTSEKYESKQGALNGIDSVKEHAPKNAAYKMKKSKDKKHYFTLRADNNKVIGVSETYENKSGMLNGIDSVMENAPIAEIKYQGAPMDVVNKPEKEEE